MRDDVPAQGRAPKGLHTPASFTDVNETSSLLPKPHPGALEEPAEGQQNGEIDDLEDERKSSSTALVLNEFLVLLKGSIPVILAYALQNSIQTLSVVIVGRGSPEDLATAAFSYMFAMSTGWLVALGGSTALEYLNVLNTILSSHEC